MPPRASAPWLRSRACRLTRSSCAPKSPRSCRGASRWSSHRPRWPRRRPRCSTSVPLTCASENTFDRVVIDPEKWAGWCGPEFDRTRVESKPPRFPSPTGEVHVTVPDPPLGAPIAVSQLIALFEWNDTEIRAARTYGPEHDPSVAPSEKVCGLRTSQQETGAHVHVSGVPGAHGQVRGGRRGDHHGPDGPSAGSRLAR